jgi:hypothetical protein
LEELGLNEADVAAIRGGNAARLNLGRAVAASVVKYE